MQGGVFGGGAFAGFGGPQALQHVPLAGMPGVQIANQPVGDWGAALGLGGDPLGPPAGHDSAAASGTEQAESSTDRQQVAVSQYDFGSCCRCARLSASSSANLRLNMYPTRDKALCGTSTIWSLQCR